MIIKILRFIIISLLSAIYWPTNMLFLLLKKNYYKWKKEDRIAFYIATPLYYFFFIVAAIISIPMETLGDQAHPPLDGFR